MIRRKGVPAIILGFALFLTSILIFEADNAAAAKGKDLKAPVIKTSQSRYQEGKAVLSWKKVKNAKKYQVYRKAKAGSKYKKFAVTKKLKIEKKSKGEYYYKIRAINGKKKGKWSKPVHLIAAAGEVYNRMDLNTSIMGLYTIRSSYLYIRVSNESRSSIKFDNKDADYKILAVDKKTGKKIEEFEPGYRSDDSKLIKKGEFDTFTLGVRNLMSYQYYYDEDQEVLIKCKFSTGKKKGTMTITVPPEEKSYTEVIK